MTTPAGQTTYTYDKNGNLLTKTDTAGTTSYVYNKANQMVSMSSPGKSVTFAYDNNGNQTSRMEGTNVTTYQYNYEGSLIKVTNPDSSVIIFTYDGNGRRISKTAAGVTTKYYYDGVTIAKETDAGGVVQADYLYGINGSPVSMTRGGQTYNYVFNGHGDTIALVDSTGAVKAAYSYDPWGVVSTSVTINNPYLYTGRFGVFHDKETGLDLMGYRYYNSAIGRFISPDELLGAVDEPITNNAYAYANDDPINKVDPIGFRADEGGNFDSDTPAPSLADLRRYEERKEQEHKTTEQTADKEQVATAPAPSKTQNKIMAALEMAGGALEAAAGTALLGTGFGTAIGVLLIANGVNHVVSGGADLLSDANGSFNLMERGMGAIGEAIGGEAGRSFAENLYRAQDLALSFAGGELAGLRSASEIFTLMTRAAAKGGGVLGKLSSGAIKAVDALESGVAKVGNVFNKVADVAETGVAKIGTAANFARTYAENYIEESRKVGIVPGSPGINALKQSLNKAGENKFDDVPKRLIRKYEVTTYEDFVNRSVVGDNLEGHEIWQHANLKSKGLATERLSTDASKNNPVIALERSQHNVVKKAQHSFDAASQTPRENIEVNARILYEIGIPQKIVNRIVKKAVRHAQNLGEMELR